MIYGRSNAREEMLGYYKTKMVRLGRYMDALDFVAESEWEMSTSRLASKMRDIGVTHFISASVPVKFRTLERFPLNPVRNHQEESAEDVRDGKFKYWGDREVQHAVETDTLRSITSSISVKDPLLVFPELVRVALDARLIGILTAYFGCLPVLSFAKLQKSFVNDLPESDTQHWHADYGAYRVVKAIVYLNTVGIDGGPFCYIKSSHQIRFPGWDEQFIFTDDELQGAYKEHRLHTYIHTGAPGDVLLAETTGFHRAMKPIQDDRTALILTYAVGPETGFRYSKTKIRRKDLDGLDRWALAVTDELEVVD